MSEIYPELFNWFNLDLQDNMKTLDTDSTHLTAETDKSKINRKENKHKQDLEIS